MSELLQIIERFSDTKVLVLGDLMLDRYIWGDAERVSPEAPVLVLRAETEEVRPGGAASVAALLRGVDAKVCLAGVIGDDSSGRVLRALLRDDGIDDNLVLCEEARRTTTKERYLGRAMSRDAHQILRVDYEHRHAIAAQTEQCLAQGVAEALADCSAVLVSDYAKGVCTPRLLRMVIDLAHARGIPILVDPGRGIDVGVYRGATLIKPNRVEAEEAIGKRIASPLEALDVARSLCHQHDFQAVVVTLDQEGIAVCSVDGAADLQPTQIRAVCDITGAGDMVLAVLGLCLAHRVPLLESTRLANLAAGLEVERQGVTVVTRSELARHLTQRTPATRDKIVLLEEMVAAAESYRRHARQIVFTNGCFDLLHVGHVTYLREAATLGDVLIVAINSDDSVRRLKGPARPVICEQHRAGMLAALSCVDHVVIFDDDTPHQLLRAIRPDVLVKGGTYEIEDVMGREFVEAYGGCVRVLGRIEGISTTEIIRSLATETNGSVEQVPVLDEPNSA